MAAFYMQWHGPNGIKKIATKVRFMSQIFMEELEQVGIVFETDKVNCFDTCSINIQKSGFSSADKVQSEFHKYGINIRKIDNNHVSVSFDELTNLYDLEQLIEIFVSLKKGKVIKEDYLPVSAFEGR